MTMTATPNEWRPREHATCRNCGHKISPDPHRSSRHPDRWVHDLDGLTACPDARITDHPSEAGER